MRTLLALLGFLFVIQLQAQNSYKHQFEVFMGGLPIQGILPEIYVSDWDESSTDFLGYAEKAGLSYGFEYSYFIGSRVSLTLHANYTPFIGQYYTENDTRYRLEQKHLTLMMGTQFYYLKPSRGVQIYSVILLGGVGVDQTIDDSNGIRRNEIGAFAFQFTPLGIRFGSRFGGSLEVGVGHKGILSAGLFYRL